MPSPDSARIIAVVAFAALTLVGMKRPVWAVIGYMVLVYCKLSHYYPFLAGMKAELVFAVVIVLRLFLTSGFPGKLSARFNSVNKYMLWFTVCVFLSYFMAMNRQYSYDNAVYHFIKVLFLYVMVLLGVDSKKDIKVFLWSFVVMFAFLAYEPMYGLVTGVGASRQMYGDIYIAEVGVLSGHVALANNMNQMIPIALFLLLSVKNKRMRVLASIPLLVFFGALIGSGSRGGVVGFLAFCAALVWFSKERKRNAVLVALLAGMLFVMSGTFKSTAGRINRGAAEGRLVGMIHGLEMVRLKGHIFGVGPGCFMLARGKYFGHTMMSHNIYGELIGDLGIPGTLICVLLMVQVFRNLRSCKNKLAAISLENGFFYKAATGMQISLIVRLFISLGSHGLYYFYWYAIAGLSAIMLKAVEEKENEMRLVEKI
jgi:hypothetical protein